MEDDRDNGGESGSDQRSSWGRGTMNKPRIHAQYEPWQNAISIYILNGKNIASNITFSKREDGLLYDPALRIDAHSAQVLMDELWQCGLRPTAGKQSEGIITAQQRHLDDMRAIVSKKLGIPALGEGK